MLRPYKGREGYYQYSMFTCKSWKKNEKKSHTGPSDHTVFRNLSNAIPLSLHVWSMKRVQIARITNHTKEKKEKDSLSHILTFTSLHSPLASPFFYIQDEKNNQIQFSYVLLAMDVRDSHRILEGVCQVDVQVLCS